MHIFKDRNGREWTLDIDNEFVDRLLAVTSVADNCKAPVDLYDLKSVGAAWTDLRHFVDLLYCCVKDQADAAGITAKDFGKAMAKGALFDAAQKALKDELEEFYPLAPREGFKELTTAAMDLTMDALKLAKAKVRKESSRLLAELAKSLDDLPESSESTPAP